MGKKAEWEKERAVHKWLTKEEAKRLVRDHAAEKRKRKR